MCNYLQPAEPARPSSFEYDDDFPSVSESFLAEMFKGKSEEDKENGWCAVFCLFVCMFVLFVLFVLIVFRISSPDLNLTALLNITVNRTLGKYMCIAAQWLLFDWLHFRFLTLLPRIKSPEILISWTCLQLPQIGNKRKDFYKIF